jgi:hypothetical protein
VLLDQDDDCEEEVEGGEEDKGRANAGQAIMKKKRQTSPLNLLRPGWTV